MSALAVRVISLTAALLLAAEVARRDGRAPACDTGPRPPRGHALAVCSIHDRERVSPDRTEFLVRCLTPGVLLLLAGGGLTADSMPILAGVLLVSTLWLVRELVAYLLAYRVCRTLPPRRVAQYAETVRATRPAPLPRLTVLGRPRRGGRAAASRELDRR